MSNSNIKSIIEAILFSSEKPVLIEQIKEVIEDASYQQIRQVLMELNQEYLQNQRGIRIVEVAGGFQMVTAEEMYPFLRKFFKKKKQSLSRATLETLAIIAYKQPITKMEIESLRKVKVDGLINNLKEMGLIKTVGRKKSPGRPYLYGTTREFLEFFGLKSLEELPKVENSSVSFSLGNYYNKNNQTNGKEMDGTQQNSS
jgi:segregation and condensation protein B